MDQKTTTAMPSMDNDNQRSGKGLKIAMAVVSAVAICGIGFGIWAALDANSQKTQIDSLKQQNAALQGQIAELNAKLDKETSGKITKEDSDYIYLEENGIKIKKSDSLPNMAAHSLDQNRFEIKENANAENLPNVISFTKASTCNKEEITMGYGGIININGTCYVSDEIAPYSAPDNLTDFLKYVLDADNYSLI